MNESAPDSSDSNQTPAQLGIPDFEKGNGLLPAIAQDAETGEVLMLAWMNRESFQLTLETSRAVYFSRSRNSLWKKGDTSGHVQQVQSIHVDCDGDAILLRVLQTGAACHVGYRSCFFRRVSSHGVEIEGKPLVDPATFSSNPAPSNPDNESTSEEPS